MRYFSICELVEADILGFFRERTDKEFFDKMQPLEEVKRKIYDNENEDKVILESEHYRGTFFIKYMQSASYHLRADLYLSKPIESTDGNYKGSILVFYLAHGYFGVLTPYMKKEAED